MEVLFRQLGDQVDYCLLFNEINEGRFSPCYGVCLSRDQDLPRDQEILQLFSFIFTLGYDVYVKKLLLEKLVDNFREVTQKQEPDTGKAMKEKPVKEKAVKDK